MTSTKSKKVKHLNKSTQFKYNRINDEKVTIAAWRIAVILTNNPFHPIWR